MSTRQWMAIAAAGWLAAVGLAGVWYGERNDRIAGEALANEAAEAYDAMAERAETHRERIARQSEQIGQLQDALDRVAEQVAALGEESTPPAEPLERAVPEAEEVAPVDSVPETPAAADGPGAGFLKAMRGMMNDEMLAYSAKQQMPSHYQPLLDALQLPAEREAAVREILERNLQERIRVGMEMMTDGGAAGAPEYDFDGAVLEELGEVLGPDEMAVAEAYQAELPERLAHQAIVDQLNMVAPTLPEESRLLIADVYVEETLAAGLTGAPESGADPVTGMAQQRVVLERVRERVAEVLPPEDLGAIDRLDDLMVNAANMFRSMSETPDPAPEP